MFDILPNLLTTIATVLFPVFASYKALRSSDPAQLTPWLMYWVVYALLDLVECTFAFILTWVPFYAYFRLMLHVYLVLPGQGGATAIYQTHIHPFLAHHEAEIEEFISNAHERARSVGLEYLNMAIEYVRVNVLGFQPRPPTPPHSRQGSYAQNLLARFNIPSAREGYSAPASDFYGLISQALSGATTGYGTRAGAAGDVTSSGTLIPPNIRGSEEKMSYVSQQRENLRVLLQAFDREAYNLASEPPEERRGAEKLSKSRSELDFDRIERDEIGSDRPSRAGRTTSGGWMPWNWGAGEAAPSPNSPNPPYPITPDENRGRSTGYEFR